MCDTYVNPILAGDYPDPSVLRVGPEYYMTHSSLPYAPGLLIWHSRNLVNWRPLTRALSNYDGDVWAPELVRHEGRFFIYYPTGGRNHVITAPAIHGPWSEPIDLKVGHIDPGHVVGPDGKRYLHLSGGHMVELADDGLSVRGDARKVYSGWAVPADWRIEGDCLESPKLVFRDGWYHMIVAQGGTAGPSTSHMVVHARSSTPEGPWENSPHNPILRTMSREEKWWSRGHGTLIDTPGGDWWIVYHAYERHYQTLGRNVLLEPVEWTADGWLRVRPDSHPARPIRRPAGESSAHGAQRSDDFPGPDLGLQWQFYGGYDRSRYEIAGGSLKLKGRGTSPSDGSPMTVIAGDHAYEVSCDLEIEAGAEAGLVLFYSPACYAALALNKDGVRIGIRGQLVHFRVPFARRRTTLKIVNDCNEVDFWYGEAGCPLKKIPESLDVSAYQHNAFGGFLSLRPGLFCSGEGTATFHHFRYRALGET